MKFTLPLPPTMNSTYRSTWNKKTGRIFFSMDKTAKRWLNDSRLKLQELWVDKIIEGPVAVNASLFLLRDRDVDSGAKILLDSLQESVIVNDKQVVSFHITKEMDKENPRAEVEVIVI